MISQVKLSLLLLHAALLWTGICSFVALPSHTGPALISKKLTACSSSNGDNEVLDEAGDWGDYDKRFLKPLQISSRGPDILTNPLFNKGTAFKMGERDRLRFRGLLPPRRLNMQIQKQRVLQTIRAETSNIRKYRALEDLHDRNVALYYRVLVDHIEEFAPIVYTPTVGQACKEFSVSFRRPRGMYFSAEDRGHMCAMVYNWPHEDVHVICVTDGSRILGLGDLGANGMGIPIGKLALYCAAGGIAPHCVLPVVLDAGTNNPELHADPFYAGVKEPRLEGPAYYELLDEFMQAVFYRWPKVLVQFEDFSGDKAQTILNKYRENHLCFNDDIQGTGSTALAGILGALRARGENIDDLSKQRIVIAGAGGAGIGVAQVLFQAMLEQGATEEQARNAFFIADKDGLIGKDTPNLSQEQAFFARANDRGLPLFEIVKKYRPTILLGLTTVGGLFNESLITEMATGCERPIIFALSNPTTNAECTAEQAYDWTDGKCIFASGSPFDPVVHNGQTFYPSQCNNMYIFPGLGLGAIVCGAKKVTDRMLYCAAVTLATFLSEEDLKVGRVFPQLNTIREVSRQVAVSVIKEADRENLRTKMTDTQMSDLEEFVRSEMYEPMYVPLVEKREVRI